MSWVWLLPPTTLLVTLGPGMMQLMSFFNEDR